MRRARLALGATALFSFLAVARVVVSVSEAYATVSSERNADAELIRLCESGQAAQSARFRNACLAAKADMASPIVLKAVLRACKLAYTDFAESFGSWQSVAMLAQIFLVSGLAAPLSRLVGALLLSFGGRRALEAAKARDSDDEEDGMREVSLVVPGERALGRWPRLKRRFLRRMPREEEEEWRWDEGDASVTSLDR